MVGSLGCMGVGRGVQIDRPETWWWAGCMGGVSDRPARDLVGSRLHERHEPIPALPVPCGAALARLLGSLARATPPGRRARGGRGRRAASHLPAPCHAALLLAALPRSMLRRTCSSCRSSSGTSRGRRRSRWEHAPHPLPPQAPSFLLLVLERRQSFPGRGGGGGRCPGEKHLAEGTSRPPQCLHAGGCQGSRCMPLVHWPARQAKRLVTLPCLLPPPRLLHRSRQSMRQRPRARTRSGPLALTSCQRRRPPPPTCCSTTRRKRTRSGELGSTAAAAGKPASSQPAARMACSRGKPGSARRRPLLRMCL